MDIKEVEGFLNIAKVVDKSLKRASARDISFEINDDLELSMLNGKEEIGILAGRALKNLGKLTGASSKLLLNQERITLQSLIKRQLDGEEHIQYLQDSQGEIISIFSGESTYVSYNDLLEPYAERVINIRGDIREDDSISVLIKSDEIDVTVNDSLIVGPFVTLCSNGMTKSVFQMGAYRLLCANGMIDTQFKNESFETVDTLLMHALANEYFNDSNYSEYFANLITNMQHTRVNKSNLFIMEGLGFNSTIKHKFLETVENNVSYNSELEGAHIKSTDTVWEGYNLLTHLSKSIKNKTSRNSAEAKALQWADYAVKASN